jgi:hypothetical protein
MKEDLVAVGTAVGSALLSFFSPIAMIVHVIMFVVALDCLTAIIKAWKQFKPRQVGWHRLIERFTVIKSRGLKKTTLKFFLYVLFVMAVYGTEIACFGCSLYITNFAAFLIIFSELVSIAENLDIIMVTNKFTGIIKRLRKLFENKLVDRISAAKPEDDNTPQEPPIENNV